MVIYEYECKDCEVEFDIIPPQDLICPNCCWYNLKYKGWRKEEE